MRRQIAGLRAAEHSAADQIPDGIFLVRVAKATYRRQAQKPYYSVSLTVLEPTRLAGHIISSRLYCTNKALWKLNWFLRDFGYDSDLLDHDELDEARLVGLQGIVKISQVIVDGSSLIRFDGFAPAGRWEELSPGNLENCRRAG